MLCYLDLDGVLADFVGGVCRLFGFDRASFYEVWPEGTWEMGSGVKFWEELEWTEDGKDILVQGYVC